MAEEFQINHEIIDIDFYRDDEFIKNSSKRCFNCRNLMYDEIERTALEKGYDFICDGNNISDLVVDRPGILVTYKKKFNTPFIEARLSSKEIHEYLNKHSIQYSRSTTCLATRIPTDTPIEKSEIERISWCENYITDTTGCEIVKLRDFENCTVCEVDNIEEFLRYDKYKQINDELKSKGFKKVCLNLAEIDDDEYIKIDYHNGSFRYNLPFTVNLDESEKFLKEEIISKTNDKIKLEKITVNADGLISGDNFKNYDDALYAFMDVLTKIRRNI